VERPKGRIDMKWRRRGGGSRSGDSAVLVAVPIVPGL
jgi:hypothetical protein